MVSTDEKLTGAVAESPPRITEFSVRGGIFGKLKRIPFPIPPASGAEPSLLVLSGRNGSGKTTILRMLDGMLDLIFDVFRRIPFEEARLTLSDGNVLAVFKTDERDFPLRVTFGKHDVRLSRKRGEGYSNDHEAKITEFRTHAHGILSQIDFTLLDIHRSAALKSPVDVVDGPTLYSVDNRGRVVSRQEEARSLSMRVRTFMAESQLNYRRFFSAGELELLPRILKRFSTTANFSSPDELRTRIRAVQSKFPVMKRFGLQTDDADLKALMDVLTNIDANNGITLTLVEAYVEMQESRLKVRELVSTRLVEFEKIMDEFLGGKTIRIDSRSGLRISSGDEVINETDLSSGEYHFLYMMVSALLCQRAGSIIAIDEPELSLHVSWQRKVVAALAKCAAGASPLFIFATHSAAIAAEHADRVYKLSPLE